MREVADTDRAWALEGLRGLLSLPAFILMFAFVGFAGIAREAGFTVGETMFMTFTIWALPAHLVLVDGVVAGAGMLTIALAVSLSSMRFMPMVMALAPYLRASGGKPWHLLVAAHFIAITSWVYTLERLESIPRHRLLAFYMGLSIPLASVVTLVTGTMHVLAAAFPPPLVAGIYFMTPLYFAMSLLKTSRLASDKLALAFGFTLGPILALAVPQLGTLLAGLGGGGRGLSRRAHGPAAMTIESIDAAWWPFLFILLVGWLPSDLWRVVGTFASGWIEPDGELIVLVRAVANALVAAVIARLVFFPTGALADYSLPLRLTAFAIGVAAYWGLGKRLFLGIVTAEVILFAVAEFI